MPNASHAALSATFDVAQLAFIAFFIFFLGLVYYLRREDKREGYPLVSDRSDNVRVQGWPPIPPPKVFVIPHEGPEVMPRVERDLTGLLAPTAPWPGAPLEPLGDPMQDGVGPASYAERADVPDLTFDLQLPKIVPLRAAPGYYLAKEDPDPRGLAVVTADGVVAGTVQEVWVDRSETFVRYLEVETAAAGAGAGGTGQRRVLGPMQLVRLDLRRGRAMVKSVFADQLAAAPGIRNPDEVTLREEDRICGYFAGGHVYASPKRTEPLL